MAESSQPLAVVTGASTGIGFELAKIAAGKGYALVIAADEPEIERAAGRLGGKVDAVQADLATTEGVDRLLEQVGARPIQVLCTNVTGTTYLLHKVARLMKRQAKGRILITGSIAGLMPGTFQAVYNGTKAYIDSLAEAMRAELNDANVNVTCLMPGPTETEFFRRADMMDTSVGTAKKDDAATVAETGWNAMMDDTGSVVAGWKNKIQAALSHYTPTPVLAEMHRRKAEPGSAKPS
jgi:short-subunit dehydrogenase